MFKNKIVLLLIFVAFGIVFSCGRKQNKIESAEDIQNNEVTKILNFPNGKKVYIRAKFWGISGDHEEIMPHKSSEKGK